ncbi:MAG: AraC family transcriptional regulator [Clostridia bacterium]
MEYIGTKLEEKISIKKLYTIHYFEYSKNYVFTGEAHNFWEMMFVDKGEVIVTAKDKTYKLKTGEMIFHEPNEFHNISSNGDVAPNIAIVSFECGSKAMKFFKDKVINLSSFEKQILSNILREARKAFSSALNDTYLVQIKKRQIAPFGACQLIKINLESLLINLIRRGESEELQEKIETQLLIKKSAKDLTEQIINFLEENLYNRIDFNDICNYTHRSGTTIKQIFKANKNMGVIDYYNDLKINEAKRLIRETSLNFTQIASKLSFTSVHYFSKNFKIKTGMTPSQYNNSIL